MMNPMQFILLLLLFGTSRSLVNRQNSTRDQSFATESITEIRKTVVDSETSSHVVIGENFEQNQFNQSNAHQLAKRKYERKFESCWNSHDFTIMFHKTACHDGWMRRLAETAVTQIIDIEHVGLLHSEYRNENGAIKIVLADGHKGFFKVCDAIKGGSTESWKSELLAHAIDRVFAVNRVPATVPRIIDFKRFGSDAEESKIATSPELLSRLPAIAKMCQGGHLHFYGSLMGWTQLQVNEKEHYNVEYTNENEFDMDHIKQHNIEFSRLIISLYLNDEPHKFGHNTMTMDTYNGDLFLVSIDNDRAHWLEHKKDHEHLGHGEQPACNRSPHHSKFTCHHFGQTRPHVKIEMRHLASYLQSACIFPRSVASRLKHFAAGVDGSDSKLRPSAAVHNYINMQHDLAMRSPDAHHFEANTHTDVFTYNRWNDTALDMRVRFMAKILKRCIDTYGYSGVVFGEVED